MSYRPNSAAAPWPATPSTSYTTRTARYAKTLSAYTTPGIAVILLLLACLCQCCCCCRRRFSSSLSATTITSSTSSSSSCSPGYVLFNVASYRHVQSAHNQHHNSVGCACFSCRHRRGQRRPARPCSGQCAGVGVWGQLGRPAGVFCRAVQHTRATYNGASSVLGRGQGQGEGECKQLM